MVGVKNIDVNGDCTSEVYFPHWIYKRLELKEELGLTGMLNEVDQDSAMKMIIVSLWCIQTNPTNRPPMSRVVDMLEGRTHCKSLPILFCLPLQDHRFHHYNMIPCPQIHLFLQGKP